MKRSIIHVKLKIGYLTRAFWICPRGEQKEKKEDQHTSY